MLNRQAGVSEPTGQEHHELLRAREVAYGPVKSVDSLQYSRGSDVRQFKV